MKEPKVKCDDYRGAAEIPDDQNAFQAKFFKYQECKIKNSFFIINTQLFNNNGETYLFKILALALYTFYPSLRAIHE